MATAINKQTEVRRQINLDNHELNPSDGNRGGFTVKAGGGGGGVGGREGGWWLKFQCTHSLNPSLLSFPFSFYGS